VQELVKAVQDGRGVDRADRYGLKRDVDYLRSPRGDPSEYIDAGTMIHVMDGAYGCLGWVGAGESYEVPILTCNEQSHRTFLFRKYTNRGRADAGKRAGAWRMPLSMRSSTCASLSGWRWFTRP
jgi:hypothetical protein